MLQYFPFNEPTLIRISDHTSKGETTSYEFALGYWLNTEDPNSFPCYCCSLGRYHGNRSLHVELPSEVARAELMDTKIALQRKDSSSAEIMN